MDIEILDLCISYLKKSKYYDTSTRILGLTLEDDNIGTMWFSYDCGAGFGRLDFESNNLSIRTR